MFTSPSYPGRVLPASGDAAPPTEGRLQSAPSGAPATDRPFTGLSDEEWAGFDRPTVDDLPRPVELAIAALLIALVSLILGYSFAVLVASLRLAG